MELLLYIYRPSFFDQYDFKQPEKYNQASIDLYLIYNHSINFMEYLYLFSKI